MGRVWVVRVLSEWVGGAGWVGEWGGVGARAKDAGAEGLGLAGY